MADWSGFLLFLIAVYACIEFVIMARQLNSLMHTAFAVSLLAVALAAISPNLDYWLSFANLTIHPEVVVEWMRVVAVSFMLCGLAVLIRNAKPVFARFPLSFTALPLLIVLTYPLARNTLVLKEWLIGIYEGGGLLIALMMYGALSANAKKYLPILGAAGLFLLVFVLYWFIPGLHPQYAWVWKLVLDAGIIVLVYGNKEITEKHELRKTREEAKAEYISAPY